MLLLYRLFKVTLKVEKYIENVDNTKPFVITGSSGSGKSTLVAHFSKKVIEFILRKLVLIVKILKL